MEILVVGDIHQDAVKKLLSIGKVHHVSREHYLHQTLFNNIDTLVVRTFSPVQAVDLAKFPQLQYVVSCSVGIDNIDLAQLKKRNITLVNCTATNANSVAEHTLYLLFALLRQDPQKPFLELKGKIVGICGFGAIGKIVAQKLQGFEAKVIAYDVVPQDEKVLKELNVTMVDLDTLLFSSDIISIHVPLFPQTREMINTHCFSKIKKNTFFINTSRAEVIDEAAFADAARKGLFRGIGLDVYSEQLKAELTISLCKNIITTPHLAAQGEDSFREQCVKPVEELAKKLKN